MMSALLECTNTVRRFGEDVTIEVQASARDRDRVCGVDGTRLDKLRALSNFLIGISVLLHGSSPVFRLKLSGCGFSLSKRKMS